MSTQPLPSPGERRARITAISNWKGGSGKTTTAVNLGDALARLGARVLVVDMDPQANLTDHFGIRQVDASVADVMLAGLYSWPDPPDLDAAIVPTTIPGLDVLPAEPVDNPANSHLASAEALVAARDPLRGQRRLARGLSLVADRYNHILIDCPPQVGALTVNALVAADEVIVPVRPERYAMKGFAALSHLIQDVRADLNPRLRLRGAILIGDARHVEMRRSVRALEDAGVPLLFPWVPLSTAVPAAAQARRASIAQLDPNHAIARAYRRLAQQILDSGDDDR